MQSPPSRRRGLKYKRYPLEIRFCVASLAEAWIEMTYPCKSPSLVTSPPSRRRGLKSVGVYVYFLAHLCRLPRGGVD